MEENWDFLVHRVGLKKQFTFGIQSLFNNLIIQTLEVKGNLHPQGKWTEPSTQKPQVIFSHIKDQNALCYLKGNDAFYVCERK